ncbi:putative transposase YbfD/YdcC [Streptosporangium lutulentum]|uniref:Transposase YbfD/YdcC n=2 Tax=Streptosporangium lutulentum TaxID=1461250 RepID=A0ABT9QCN7_9ACTN|nr:putative transposase YbfD/YdcC [Streptosporangium lutulentum]
MAFGSATVGGNSITAISHWAHEAPQDVLAALGCWRDPLTGRCLPPSERTLRRVLADVDGNEVDRHAAAYLAESPDDREGQPAGDPPGSPMPREREARRAARRQRRQLMPEGLLPSAAFDGKVLRGARLPGGGQVRLLSLFDTTGGTVVAQRQIGAKSTEVPELAPLLTGLDLAGMVLTGDALHTVRESARHLTGDHRAHYVLLLKDNQPTLLAAAIRALSGTDTDFATRTHTMTDRGHGRTETRTIRTAPAVDVGFPGAAQLFRILRYRGGLDGVRISKEVVFGLSSLPADLAGPEHLNHYVRSHWGVENREHYVRDVTFGEDAGQVRTGQLPHVMAAIRNLVIGAFRQQGHSNIAHARRHYGYAPHRLLTLFSL